MAITLRFEIEVLSDYHVGSGYGHGAQVDSTLFRDGDGTPVLRGSTVSGLLRDSLWRLMQAGPLAHQRACKASGKSEPPDYCGQYEDDDIPCPLCRLFGSPAQPKHWEIGSARLTQVPVPTNQGGWQSQQRDAEVTHRVRVSPRTRRAMPGHLFAEEVGSHTVAFQFEIICHGESDVALDEAALWVAAARNLRQFGRSRRRGHGECRFTLTGAENLPQLSATTGRELQDALLDRFQSAWLGDSPPGKPHQGKASGYEVTPETGEAGQPVYFRLLVRLDEPVLVAQRLEAGNQYETRLTISGSTLRGAFAWIAGQRWSLEASPAREDFRKVFLGQGALFSNLFPCLWRGTDIVPAIPPPLDLQTCKVFRGRTADGVGRHGACVVTDPEEDNTCLQCPEGLEPFAEFLPIRDLTLLDPEDQEVAFHSQVEMHNAIDPHTNRVGNQALFGYAALAAGKYLAGDLFFPDAVDWQRFQQLTGVRSGQSFPLRLGRASRRGYGKVTAYLEKLEEEPAPTLIMQPLDQRLARGNNLKLTLLSDLIMHDKWGRYYQGFEEAPDTSEKTTLSKWLQDELGLSLGVTSVIANYRWVDGFHYTHSLPRWRALAITAGSVLNLKLPANIDAEQIRRLAGLEWQGIGDRRDEGYGRFALNHPIYTGCPGIKGTIDLVGEMRLSSAPKSDETEFRETWHQRLDVTDIEQLCKVAPLRALASWLHSRRKIPIGHLLEQLSEPQQRGKFGAPNQELVAAIGGDDEYGHREKESRFFRGDNDESAGRQEVHRLLVDLAANYPPEQHPVGIEMLAERVALAARSAKPQ